MKKITLCNKILLSLNIAVQSATMTMYLRQGWRDPRLSFQSTNGIDKIRAFVWDKIWTPDTYVRQSIRSRTHDVSVANRLLTIKSSGDVWYAMK